MVIYILLIVAVLSVELLEIVIRNFITLIDSSLRFVAACRLFLSKRHFAIPAMRGADLYTAYITRIIVSSSSSSGC